MFSPHQAQEMLKQEPEGMPRNGSFLDPQLADGELEEILKSSWFVAGEQMVVKLLHNVCCALELLGCK